jgi:hypothetical protein
MLVSITDTEKQHYDSVRDIFRGLNITGETLRVKLWYETQNLFSYPSVYGSVDFNLSFTEKHHRQRDLGPPGCTQQILEFHYASE